VLTATEIARLKSALKLSPDQARHWPAVEAVLREAGAQQAALVQAGRKPDEAFNGALSGRLYMAAGPLLSTLREDQKNEIRKRARALGLEVVASRL